MMAGDDDEFTVPVRPMVYFRDFANGNRVPRSITPTTVELPQFLLDWLGFAIGDIPGDDHSDVHVASLALKYGADRPIHDWGYSVDEFEDIATHGCMKVMNGGLRRKGWPTMDTGEWRMQKKIGIRLEQQTQTKVSIYQRFLGLNDQSPVIRHLMALAFRWYSRPVYLDETTQLINRETQKCVDRLRWEFDDRLRMAEERGWLD